MALIQENVPLAPLTTFGIGGPARYFVDAKSVPDVLDALDFASTNDLPLFVLGGGSNLLVADEGFPGLVLRIGLKGISFEPSGDRTLVHAQSGEDWDGLVAQAVERDLAGIECLSGIPGLVGGTPVQNVGAYGQEIADVLVAVRALDRSDGGMRTLSHADCGFAYRTSVFNTRERDRYIVLAVTCTLRNSGRPAIEYADVRRRFENRATPSLSAVRNVVREIRASKAMLITESDPDSRSAGSFFKNPIITEAEFTRIQSLTSEPVPRYSAPGGHVKTAAAWLIERSGVAKGFAIGSAAVSRKHTLALVNKGGASAVDVLHLAREIRRRVEDRFGVHLVPEPVFLGFHEKF